MTPDGLMSIRSAHPPAQTAERLIEAVTRHGMGVMARIDHAGAAPKVGLDLRPTEVLIFGNPKAGTLLMQQAQTMGIDLPLKALIWQDEAGVTWLSYNDPAWLAARHRLGAGGNTVIATMNSILESCAREAAGDPISAAGGDA